MCSFHDDNLNSAVFLSVRIRVVGHERPILSVAGRTGLTGINRSECQNTRQNIDGPHGGKFPIVLVAAMDRNIVGVTFDSEWTFGLRQDIGNIFQKREGPSPDPGMSGLKQEGRLNLDPDSLARLDHLHGSVGGRFLLNQLHGPE